MTESPYNRFKCITCGRKTTSLYNLQRHTVKEHGRPVAQQEHQPTQGIYTPSLTSKPLQMFRCTGCAFLCATVQVLRLHIRKAHNRSPTEQEGTPVSSVSTSTLPSTSALPSTFALPAVTSSSRTSAAPATAAGTTTSPPSPSPTESPANPPPRTANPMQNATTVGDTWLLLYTQQLDDAQYTLRKEQARVAFYKKEHDSLREEARRADARVEEGPERWAALGQSHGVEKLLDYHDELQRIAHERAARSAELVAQHQRRQDDAAKAIQVAEDRLQEFEMQQQDALGGRE